MSFDDITLIEMYNDDTILKLQAFLYTKAKEWKNFYFKYQKVIKTNVNREDIDVNLQDGKVIYTIKKNQVADIISTLLWLNNVLNNGVFHAIDWDAILTYENHEMKIEIKAENIPIELVDVYVQKMIHIPYKHLIDNLTDDKLVKDMEEYKTFTKKKIEALASKASKALFLNYAIAVLSPKDNGVKEVIKHDREDIKKLFEKVSTMDEKMKVINRAKELIHLYKSFVNLQHRRTCIGNKILSKYGSKTLTSRRDKPEELKIHALELVYEYAEYVEKDLFEVYMLIHELGCDVNEMEKTLIDEAKPNDI